MNTGRDGPNVCQPDKLKASADARSRNSALVEIPRARRPSLPGEAEFPSPPALPECAAPAGMLVVRVCGRSAGYYNIVRSDIGLTLSCCAWRHGRWKNRRAKSYPIGDIVVHRWS
jgi:hypothetical protein